MKIHISHKYWPIVAYLFPTWMSEHEMINILLISYTNIPAVKHHQNMFLRLDILWDKKIKLVAMVLPYVYIPN